MRITKDLDRSDRRALHTSLRCDWRRWRCVLSAGLKEVHDSLSVPISHQIKVDVDVIGEAFIAYILQLSLGERHHAQCTMRPAARVGSVGKEGAHLNKRANVPTRH